MTYNIIYIIIDNKSITKKKIHSRAHSQRYIYGLYFDTIAFIGQTEILLSATERTPI